MDSASRTAVESSDVKYYFWPWRWPQPPEIGLSLVALASASFYITG